MSSNVNTNINMGTLASQETLPAAAADEQRLRRLYGNKKPLGPLDRFRQAKGRKQYFDSGEYAMAQAGTGDTDVDAMGSQHPSPESIPHPVTPTNNPNGSGSSSKVPGAVLTTGPHISQGSLPIGSPVKETSFLSRETSADDMNDETETNQQQEEAGQPQQSVSAAQNGADSLPIRT